MPPCHAPNFRYHSQNLMSWLKLSHRFQRHYYALHNLLSYPYVMPLTPKTVNPYLTPPNHIANSPNNDTDDPYQSKYDTNVLPSAHDARQLTSKWSNHEDKESITSRILGPQSLCSRRVLSTRPISWLGKSPTCRQHVAVTAKC